MRFSTKTQGLSILEAVIYIAILAAMLAVVINTLLIVGASYHNLRVARLVTTSARDVMERATREIRNAVSVNQIGSTFGSHPGNLVLNTLDASKNPTTAEFYLENATVKIREGGVYAGDLTHPDVWVDNFVFRFIDASSSEAVRLELMLTATSGSATSSDTFYITAVLRGSY